MKIGADPLRWYRGARSGVPEEDDDVADANTGPPSVSNQTGFSGLKLTTGPPSAHAEELMWLELGVQ